MEMPLVSVIVPVYNSEHSLPACVDALLGQTYERLEILLVNDGSTDSSALICRDYERQDPRVVYICQRNRGVSAARNEGLRRASGKYVMFSDSDDRCDVSAAEVLVQKAEESSAGWIVGGVRKTVHGAVDTVLPEEGCFFGKEMDAVLRQLYDDHLLRQLWGKLYLTDIIRKHRIYLREDIHNGEDMEWNCRYLMHVNAMAVVPEITYHYFVNSSQSLSQRFDVQYFNHLQLQYDALKALLVSRGIWQDWERDVLCRGAKRLLSGYGKIASRECPLNFGGKTAYISDGMRTPLRFEFIGSIVGQALPFARDLLIRCNSPLFAAAAICLIKRKKA